MFFINKFVGLKDEIRTTLVLHKPRTVDAALSLALLQEEELVVSSKSYQGRQEHKDYNKFGHKPMVVKEF